MEYDMETFEDILENLKEDPMRVIYTEHYLDQIEKRGIPDVCIEELLEKDKLIKIAELQNQTFGLHFDLDESGELIVIAKPFNLKSIILISASFKNNGINPPSDHALEFEGIYDRAFDLMDLHSTYGFKYNQTIEMEPDFNVDFDSGGHPVAVEMIHPSRKFNSRPEIFSTVTLEGQIEVTPESIKVRLKASFIQEKIEARIIEKEIPNKYGIPANVFELAIGKLIN